jgi:DNA-binding NtrC family response regulator
VERKSQRKRLLIVDDEPAVLKVAEKALGILSLETETATDEAGALKLLKDKPFDILLVDLKLKENDGLGIIRESRKLHPKIYTILMTGTLTSEELKKRILKARVNKVIFKPFTVYQLRDVVKECLKP